MGDTFQQSWSVGLHDGQAVSSHVKGNFQYTRLVKRARPGSGLGSFSMSILPRSWVRHGPWSNMPQRYQFCLILYETLSCCDWSHNFNKMDINASLKTPHLEYFTYRHQTTTIVVIITPRFQLTSTNITGVCLFGSCYALFCWPTLSVLQSSGRIINMQKQTNLPIIVLENVSLSHLQMEVIMKNNDVGLVKKPKIFAK